MNNNDRKILKVDGIRKNPGLSLFNTNFYRAFKFTNAKKADKRANNPLYRKVKSVMSSRLEDRVVWNMLIEKNK